MVSYCVEFTPVYDFTVGNLILTWFNSLKDKHLMKFVMFDIKDIYPSITQDLLNNAPTFANE